MRAIEGAFAEVAAVVGALGGGSGDDTISDGTGSDDSYFDLGDTINGVAGWVLWPWGSAYVEGPFDDFRGWSD
jgi:hypothetical protein